MLAYVDNREYKNPMLIERAIPTLKNAKMFALESNLFHRLTFLNNVLTHY